MNKLALLILVVLAITACTIIIGTNTTNLDRDSGIMMEIEDEKQNTDEKENEEAHKGAKGYD